MGHHGIRGSLATSVAIYAVAIAAPALAQDKSFNLPAQPAATGIPEFARQADIQILVSETAVHGKRTRSVKGAMSVDLALRRLLGGTGLHITSSDGRTFTLTSAVGNGNADRSGSPSGKATPSVGDAPIARGGISRSDDILPAGRDEDVGAEGRDILVTGTRIRGRGPVGSPVLTIDRTAIDQSGYATTQQIAQSIPQNFVGGPNEGSSIGGTLGQNAGLNTSKGSSINLRGLGPSSTLVLLNGDRAPLGGYAGAFSDISMIPASAIQRIEVVADGASAIYGSDAVAGVVNIVPRLDFHGAETSFRIGTAGGDSQEYQFSQLLGARWSGGHAVIAYEFYQRDRLRAADRDFSTDDLRRFGGADYRGAYANPGTIVAGGTTFAIPAGQNGVGLSPASLTAGTVNRGDSWYGADILPQQRRHSVFAAASQDFGNGLRLYANGLLTIRSFDEALRPTANAPRTVPVTNPFYVDPVGTHQPVSVEYSFVRDLGNERARGIASAFGGTLGLEAHAGPWVIDGHGTWGHEFERSTLLNRINSARLAAALADTNPATAYNLFGDGPNTNPATIASIRGSSISRDRGTVWSATLRADGPLLRLPAGDARLAIGGEYREERYRDGGTVADTSSLTPTFIPGYPLPNPRRVSAGYAELFVPVFGDGATLPGFHRLDLSAAVRTEHYSDFGATTNPKFGASWEPVAGLTIRGTYGTSFRAPSFQDLRQDSGSQLVFPYTVPDPQSPTGQSNIIVIRRNDPNLKPERATTWTLGADLKPAFLPGAHAGVTWFKVDYRDRIASPSAQLFNFLVNRSTYAGIIEPNPSPARVAELYASPYFSYLLNIPPTATFAAVVDASLQNLSIVKQSGLDLDLGYGFAAFGGTADLGASGTYIFHIRQAITASAPVNDVVGILGNPVDFRARGHVTWASQSVGAALFANYVDGYTNKTNATPQHVGSWTTFDLQLSY
ncbi:MAG: TonB-dependent receptor, partial [Sphingomonas sp.]